MQLSLTGSSAGTVASGSPVLFDTVDVNTTVGIGCTPNSGKVTIGRTGTYLVNWWVAVENAQAAELMAFAVTLNGTDVQTSYADIGGGQVYGSAVVNVTSLPATLSLVNQSGDAVTYATAEGQASMTITQLA